MPGPANRIIASTGGGHRHEGGFDDGIAIDYVHGVVHDAAVALPATHMVGIVPFSMTRLGHDFLIRKHTFTEAPALAADAVWFADRTDLPAFDPTRLWKGNAMRYVLGLAVQLFAMLLEIAGTIWLALFWFCDDEPESDPRRGFFYNTGFDDGFDQFGYPMTPAEEDAALVKRKSCL